MKKLNKKGFTLIELIVVIAILAILAAILVPAIFGYVEEANVAKDQTNARSFYSTVALAIASEKIGTVVEPTGCGFSGTTLETLVTYCGTQSFDGEGFTVVTP